MAELVKTHGYINPAALTPLELAYELQIRGIEPVASKNTNHNRFQSIQEHEARTGEQPSGVTMDFIAELEQIASAMRLIEKTIDDENNGTRMTLASCDTLMYRLQHYTCRVKRIPCDPGYAGQLAEIVGRVDRARRNVRSIGSRKIFQARNGRNAAAQWHHEAHSTLNATAAEFDPAKSANGIDNYNSDQNQATLPMATHSLQSAQTTVTHPNGDGANERQHRISVRHEDLTLDPNRNRTTNQEPPSNTEWFGQHLDQVYQSVENDVRRQTQGMFPINHPPCANSSAVNILPPDLAARRSNMNWGQQDNLPPRNQAVNNDQLVQMFSRLLESQLQVQQTQNATLQLLQRSMDQRQEVPISNRNIFDATREARSDNSRRNETEGDTNNSDWNSSDARRLERRRSNGATTRRNDTESDRTEHRRNRIRNGRSDHHRNRETSSDDDSRERRRRHHKRRPANPSQWNFIFTGDPKGSNSKETTAHEFLSALEAFRYSEDLSKRDILASLTQLLSGTARRWWITKSRTLTRYDDFVREFKNQWFPAEFEVLMEYDLMTYKQKEESITSFLIEFENRASYLETRLEERKLVSIAKKNVREEFRKQLATIEIRGFNHLKSLCKRLEDASNAQTNPKQRNPRNRRRRAVEDTTKSA